MGWYYRKSLRFGPFRVNLSKSGVGYSFGGAGFRTGRSASGRRYNSISVPGTGLRYVQYAKTGRARAGPARYARPAPQVAPDAPPTRYSGCALFFAVILLLSIWALIAAIGFH